MKCNLVVAGFAKCGTSSLHEYLDLHPQVCMSSTKEPHYFSKKDIYEKGPEWHDSLFVHAAKDVSVFGESSTSYSVWEPALVRIKQDLSNPKLILIMRDPLERMLSHYRWMQAQGLEKLCLEKALDAEEILPVSPEIHRIGCYPWYRRASHYSYFIPLIQIIFGEENVLLLKSKDLADTPAESMKQCFSFLGLEPFDFGDLNIRANETSSKRARRGTGLGWAYKFLPSSLKQNIAPLREMILKMLGTKKITASEPSPELLDKLYNELSADRLTYESIGQD
jgi:hypothetical protein